MGIKDGIVLEFPLPDPVLSRIARKNLIFSVQESGAGSRLDRFTAEASGLSRGMVRALIDFGSVWVGGKVCRRQSRILEAGDWVTLQAPAYGPVKFYEARPERILFQDRWLLAYDKEAGLPCQQTPYDGYNHLAGALKRRLGTGYLALHHRLDSPTSGVMVFAVHREANPGLSRLFREGPLEKTYLAVVKNRPDLEAWEIDRPIAKRKGEYFCPADGRGKPARTLFSVLSRSEDAALIQARPLTGRTHQIRLHLQASGLPILGDPAYGGPPARRLMLHALRLSFPHPVTGKNQVFEAPVPEEFEPITIPGRQ